MQRGPMALFGAIVAVGLGPAMWLGAQFGAIGAVPSQRPVVDSNQQANQAPAQQQKGGEAGSAPEDPSVVLETKPRTNHRPLKSTPSPSRSPHSRATENPDGDDDPTTGSAAVTTSASPSADSTPTESASQPPDPPTVPPDPPSTDSSTGSESPASPV